MEEEKTLVLNSKQIEQKINRIAHQIYENNFEEKDIIIAGVVTQGFMLANRIAKVLTEISSCKIHLSEITVNKDAPLHEGVCCELTQKEYKNKVIILVDDVVNSGKTLMYAARLFLEAPVKKITTVALVDRKHRRYPIRIDFVGLSLATTLQEHISVQLGKKDAVYLV